ncbi:uncharacterized protein K441DRAFT_662342, partial [Cenococcum geophilum 1.58]|uniref:uncharacterized protein n=1 Tax=Cenococcum geophilum 1.58 TaxID=794803 RepID=UPI00358EF50D
MVSRDPSILPTVEAFENHLSWNLISNTPFRSFFINRARTQARKHARTHSHAHTHTRTHVFLNRNPASTC